jgi:hypothetical protein
VKKLSSLFPESESRSDRPRPLPTDWPFVTRVLSSSEVRTAYVWGPPGTGKTYAALTCGVATGDAYPVTLTEDTATAELRGFYRPLGQDIVWGDGPVTTAMREGKRLVLNEITHASQEVFTFLHPILEHPETACVTLPSGEIVRPSPGFKVIATSNHPPEDLPFALRDRFDCILEVQDPHPDALARLSPALRRAAERSIHLEGERRVGLRGWLSVQRLEPVLGLLDACRAAFGPARGVLIHDALRLAEQS